MITTTDIQALNPGQFRSSRTGKLMRGLAAAFLLTAAIFASQPTPAQATPWEECVKSCVADYYPFHLPCVGGCTLMDIVFGVAGGGGGGLEPSRPGMLGAKASSRTAVELQVGSFDEDSGTLRGDSRALAVVYSYASLADLEGRDYDGASWREIGEATEPSRSALWPLIWDASGLKSGHYLLRAEFIQADGSKFAITTVEVP